MWIKIEYFLFIKDIKIIINSSVSESNVIKYVKVFLKILLYILWYSNSKVLF